jgi:hypothetical protein
MSTVITRLTALGISTFAPLLLSAQIFTALPANNPVPTDAMPLLKKTRDMSVRELSKTDFTGHYAGKRYQYTEDHTSILRTYSYEMDITQSGNDISGTTKITGENGDYGVMKVRGTVMNGTLYFEEYELVDQKKSDLLVWCYKVGQLQMGKHSGNLAIYGPTNSYTSKYYYPCTGGFTVMEKVATDITIADNQPTDNTVTDVKVTDDMNVFPVPFTSSTTLSYTLAKDAKVLIEMFDINGARVKSVANENQASGTHQLTIDANMLPAGVYILRLSVDGVAHSKEIVKAGM